MKLTLFQVDLDPTYNPHLLLQQGGTEHYEFQVLFVLNSFSFWHRILSVPGINSFWPVSFLNSFLPQISICLDPMIYVPRRHCHNIWQGISKSKPIEGKQLQRLGNQTSQNALLCRFVWPVVGKRSVFEQNP